MKITLNQNLIASLFIGVAILVLAFVLLTKPFDASFAGSAPMAPAQTVATTSAAFSITTSARILATTTNPLAPANSFVRAYTSICTSGANPIAINMDGDKPANAPLGRVTAWIAVAAGYAACYEITDRNLNVGSITASSTNGTASPLTVKDYVYQ